MPTSNGLLLSQSSNRYVPSPSPSWAGTILGQQPDWTELQDSQTEHHRDLRRGMGPENGVSDGSARFSTPRLSVIDLDNRSSDSLGRRRNKKQEGAVELFGFAIALAGQLFPVIADLGDVGVDDF